MEQHSFDRGIPFYYVICSNQYTRQISKVGSLRKKTGTRIKNYWKSIDENCIYMCWHCIRRCWVNHSIQADQCSAETSAKRGPPRIVNIPMILNQSEMMAPFFWEFDKLFRNHLRSISRECDHKGSPFVMRHLCSQTNLHVDDFSVFQFIKNGEHSKSLFRKAASISHKCPKKYSCNGIWLLGI